MKKLKLNFVMIAVVLGATAAFAFKPIQHKANVKDGIWQDTKLDGSLKLTSQGGSTYDNETDAINSTGCGTSVTTNFCVASVDMANGTETGNYIYQPE